jgi:hypothetical protein
MKTKLFLLTVLFAFAGMVFAQDTQALEFKKRTHDFGTIQEADGRVEAVFEFKNISNKPITLTNVRASCGCTTPNWPKEPIAPGKSSYITATYNPAGRPGNFNKSITIHYLKAGDEKASAIILNIKGSVVPQNQAK